MWFPTPPHRLAEITKKINARDFKWISNMQATEIGDKSVHENDFSVLDAVRLNSRSPGHYSELFKIARLRGWRMCVAFFMSTDEYSQSMLDRYSQECNFWHGIHSLCSGYGDSDYVSTLNDFNDESVYTKLSQVPHDHVNIFLSSAFVGLCLKRAWVESAKFLLDTQKITFLNKDYTKEETLQRHVDRDFYKGMTTCIRLSNEAIEQIKLGHFSTWSYDVLQEIQRKDELGCQLLRLFLIAGYVPQEYESLLVYADIMQCTKLQEILMTEMQITPYSWFDIRLDTKFVRDAAYYGETETVELLVNHGYAINSPGREFSILHELAAGIEIENQFSDMFQLLCKLGADKQKKDMYGRSALHLLAYNPYSYDLENWVARNKAKFLQGTECLDDMGRSPLHHVAAHRTEHVEVLTIFWEDLGFSLLHPDLRGHTPIHICARTGNIQLLEMIERRTAYLADLHSDKFGMTLFAAAAEGCRRRVTEFLLDHCETGDNSVSRAVQIATLLDTKINDGEHVGKSLMFIACQIGSRTRVCGYLDFMIARGASIHLNDRDDNNLMHAVATCNTSRDEQTEITDFYPDDRVYHFNGRRKGVNFQDGGNCKEIIQKLFHLKPAMLLHSNYAGKTPLIAALYESNNFAVAAFLSLARKNFDHKSFHHFIHSSDRPGVSPLNITLILHDQLNSPSLSSSSSSKVELHDRYLYIAELLLGAGAQIDAHSEMFLKTLKSRHGMTPATKRVLRMAFIRTPHMHRNRPVGFLAKLPPELFEPITIDAVNDPATLELLSPRDPKPLNFWEDKDLEFLSDDEYM